MKTFGVVARVKAPEGYVGVWVNIYDYDRKAFQSGGNYLTRKEADDIAKSYRYDCVYIHIKKRQVKLKWKIVAMANKRI